MPFLLAQKQVQKFLIGFFNFNHLLLHTLNECFFPLGLPSIHWFFPGLMGLGGEQLPGVLNWSISYQRDCGWATVVECATLMWYTFHLDLRSGVHLHSGPWVVTCCLEVVYIAARFWLGGDGNILLGVFVYKGGPQSSGSLPLCTSLGTLLGGSLSSNTGLTVPLHVLASLLVLCLLMHHLSVSLSYDKEPLLQVIGFGPLPVPLSSVHSVPVAIFKHESVDPSWGGELYFSHEDVMRPLDFQTMASPGANHSAFE